MKTPAREVRVIESSLEIRALSTGEAGDSRTVRGYAAKFGTESQMLRGGDGRYQFRETIQAGAFDGASMADVRALFNHDSNRVLARSRDGEGTLKLGVDEIGLWYEFDAPNNTTGNDLLESVRRGDIDQSSFAFSIAEGGESWEESGINSDRAPRIYKRTITKIASLYDVSPVTEPAYADTSVAVRSLEALEISTPEDPAPTLQHSITHRQRALDLIDKTANN